MAIRNETLHDCMAELLQRYFRFVQKRMDDDHTMPRRRLPKMDLGEAGAVRRVEIVDELDWGSAIPASLHDFVKDRESDVLIQGALAQPEICRVLEQLKVALVPMAFGYNILQPMALKLAYAQRGLEFSEAIFESKYPELEQYLSADMDPYSLSVPLANVVLAADHLTVGPFTVRKMTGDEFRMFVFDGSFGAQSLGLSDCLLELRVRVPRGGPPLSSSDRDRLWWFVACLKLLKPGSVGYDQIHVRPMGWTGISFAEGSVLRLVSPLGKAYSLSGDDVPELDELWRHVEPLVGEHPPFWYLGLHRFSDAVNRVRTEDRLIDLWVACESLFGRQGESGENMYRLSLRIAHLIEEDPVKRAEVRERAKRAYRSRNSVVHGGSDKRVAESGRDMEEFTRRALRKLIASQYTTHDVLIDEIERSILGGRTDPESPP